MTETRYFEVYTLICNVIWRKPAAPLWQALSAMVANRNNQCAEL
jgi:hypothetical protein